MRQTDTWLIRAISNLHAGSGDADFGIIDKHVQRDPVTGLPIIFASGIKGALRQIFDTEPKLFSMSSDIFGSSASANVSQQGAYRFYDANLLAIPMRSSHQFYYPATCVEVIKDFVANLEQMNSSHASQIATGLQTFLKLVVAEGAPQYTGQDVGETNLEDYSAMPTNLSPDASTLLHRILDVDRLAILHCNDFDDVCKRLPTIARNHLNNGVSQNLWYEEIVPRETRFYLQISRPNGNTALQNAIENGELINQTIQIGGNATVGFGLCEIKMLAI